MKRIARGVSLALLSVLGCSSTENTQPLGAADMGVVDLDSGANDVAVTDAGALDGGIVECFPDGDSIIRDQAGVDRLRGCEAVIGALHLNSLITDLSGLTTVRYISSVWVLEGFGATDLTGLESVESIGQLIVQSSALESLHGLTNLSEVPIDLNLNGSGLRQIDLPLVVHLSRLTLTNNAQLESLRGLSGLESVRSFRLTSRASHRSLPPSEIDAFIDRVDIESIVFGE